MTQDTERYRVWLRELALQPTAPHAHSAIAPHATPRLVRDHGVDRLILVPASTSISEPRRCAQCDRRLRKGKRVDAITCSKSCRQKRSREKTRSESSKVSRRSVVARHVLSDSARARATPFPDAVPSHVPTENHSKRVTSIGRVRGVEVHID